MWNIAPEPPGEERGRGGGPIVREARREVGVESSEGGWCVVGGVVVVVAEGRVLRSGAIVKR